MKPFGGCYKLEVLMNQLLSSIVAQNVNTLGEITHKVKFCTIGM